MSVFIRIKELRPILFIIFIFCFTPNVISDVLVKSMKIAYDANQNSILHIDNSNIIINNLSNNTMRYADVNFTEYKSIRLLSNDLIFLIGGNKEKTQCAFYNYNTLLPVLTFAVSSEVNIYDITSDSTLFFYVQNKTILRAMDISSKIEIFVSLKKPILDLHIYNNELYVIYKDGEFSVLNFSLDILYTAKFGIVNDDIINNYWGTNGNIIIETPNAFPRIVNLNTSRIDNRVLVSADSIYINAFSGNYFLICSDNNALTFNYKGDCVNKISIINNDLREAIKNSSGYVLLENVIIIYDGDRICFLNLFSGDNIVYRADVYGCLKFSFNGKNIYSRKNNGNSNDKRFNVPQFLLPYIDNIFKYKRNDITIKNINTEWYSLITSKLQKISILNDDYYIFSHGLFDSPNEYKFSNGLLLIKQFNSYKYGYIDYQGDIVIEPNYEYALPFSDGLAVVKINGLYYFINKCGEIVLGGYEKAFSFHEGMAWVKNNGKIGCINTRGEIVFYKDCYPHNYSDGLALIDGTIYIDYLGKTIIDISNNYTEGKSFNEGLAPVINNGKWGYINKDMKLVIPCLYDDAEPFYEGYAAVKINDRWGFINKNNEILIKPEYYLVSNFNGGYAIGIKALEKNGQVYYFSEIIDHNGSKIFQCDRRLGIFSEGVFLIW